MGKKSKNEPKSGQLAAPVVLGIDLGGTKILASAVDRQGRIIGSAKRKTRSERGVDATIERILKTAYDAVDDANLDMDQISAVGIGAPGVADYDAGVVEFAPNLSNWVNVPLGPTLKKALGIPVFVENDVNAGTYGEYTVGAARGYQSVLGVFPGTGIGGGIILGGKLWRGARNAAAEIGHFVVMIDGPVCGCGRRGCIEAVASRTAIERDILGEIRGGRPSIVTDLVNLDKDRITSGTLAEALAKGDPLVTDVIERAAYHLGVFTAGMVNTLDTECVVYGGGLIEACADVMLPIIREATYRYLIRPVEPEHLPIIEAALGDDAVLLGAAMLASASLPHKQRT
ncbi:MAG: ROK family protein [Anaerolineae bacterium]|nr:ROK family protein [Anaerolineae bacterium]